MPRMLRIIGWLAVFGCVFIQIAIADPVRVGVIAPMSGPLAEVGQTVVLALKISQETFDSKGLVNLVFEDDQYSPKQAVTAARKLLDIDKVKFLIVWGSPSTAAVAPIAESEKVPMIAMMMSEAPVQNKKYVFKLFPKISEETALVSAEVAKKKYQAIAVISSENEAMNYTKDVVEKTLPAKIAVNESVLPGEMDFKTIALKIKQAGVDATFLNVLPPSASELALQLKRIGYRGEFFGLLPLRLRSEMIRASGALEGAWFSTFNEERSHGLQQSLEKRYNNAFMPDGAISYDAFKLMLQTVSQPLPWQEYLANMTSFDGIFGPETKQSGENSFSVPLVLKKIQNNEFANY